VELGEVGEGLEHIQGVEGELRGALELIAEGPRDHAEASFVLEHVLHVLVEEAEVEAALGRLDLRLGPVFVEFFQVVVQLLDADPVKINLGFLGVLRREGLTCLGGILNFTRIIN